MKQNTPQIIENYNSSWSTDSIRLYLTPSAFARKTFFYVQEAGFFKTKAPYFTTREHLESYLLLYTVHGRGILHYLGESYSLTPGTLFFIDCTRLHHYECPSHTDWDFYWVHFQGFSAASYFEESYRNGFHLYTFPPCNTTPGNTATEWAAPGNIKADNSMSDCAIPCNAMSRSTAPNLDMSAVFAHILSLAEEKPCGYEAQLSLELTGILTALLLADPISAGKASDADNIASQICSFLDAHYRDSLSLDDLARHFHLSKYHLSREFKRCTCTSPYEYLLICRINHAKEHLRTSHLSVQEIAAVCGFGQTSHFIELFKKYEGITPLAYRKQWQ